MKRTPDSFVARNDFVALDGQIIRAVEACIPIDDRAFLYGDSVFTTLRCYSSVPFRLDRHVKRLNASLASPLVGIEYVADEATLRDTITRLVELNGCPDAVVRFRVTRGSGAGPVPPNNATPMTLLTVDPLQLNESISKRGARLIVSTIRRDPAGELGKHKLGSYFSSCVARREATAQGADEAIITDTDGHWLECTASNLFAVLDGALVTPPTTQNLLPGIARETVLDCAKTLGIPIRLEPLAASLVKRAEEWFITNSVQQIVPVSQIKSWHGPVPGPITQRFIAAYRACVVGSSTS